MLVLIWHYGNNQVVANDFSFLHYFRMATSFFWSGVDLFFVLSGFLLGGILLDNRKAENYFKAFYVRRIFRIFPLYYFYFILFLILFLSPLNGMFPWLCGGPFKPIPLWSYATYTQNFLMSSEQSLGVHGMVVTWSLAVEEQFYLVLPLLIFLLPGRILAWVCAALILASPFFRYYGGNWYQSFALLHCRADSLLTGVLLAYVLRQERAMNFLQTYKWGVYILFSALLLLVGAMSFYFYLFPVNYVAINSIVALLYALLILIVSLYKNSFIAAAARSRWLVKTGIISYGIYIYHLFVSGILHQLLLGRAPLLSDAANLGVTLLSLAVTFGLAWVSYHYFEKKLIAIGHRTAYRH